MTLPPGLLAESQEVANADDWMWLLRLTVDVTTLATTQVQLCTGRTPVTYNSTQWNPYPFKVGNITLSASNGVPSFDLTVSNAQRSLSALLFQGSGFIGREAALFLTHRAWLATPTEVVPFTATVQGWTADKEALTLRCQPRNPFKRVVPSAIFHLNGCDHVYRDARCRARGTILVCNHNHEDCVTIGNHEVSLGYPRLHPQNFGGFVSAPRQS